MRIVVLALLATLVACGGEESSPPPVDRVAEQIAGSGAESVIVFVSDDGEEHVATAGATRPSPDQRFRIGSVTKTFTAAIVLQLVEEGKLRLDSTLEDHLPAVVPEGDKMTIRHLLSHHSGLVDITDYSPWLDQASRSSSTRPLKTLRFAASHPLEFAPGSYWRYSNTNYIALGLVIEKVTASSYAEELEQRILDPLELDRTEFPTERRLPDLDDDGENPNLPWAAGAIVSNAHDVSRFFSALLSGQVLSDESLTEMTRPVADDGAAGVGLGLFSTETRCGRFWGHEGGILDYATLVNASEEGERVVVLSVKGGSPSSPPDESALQCEATTTDS